MPIDDNLRQLLIRAADAVRIDTVIVTSGGQPATGPNRTGSHRHDNGNAADLQLWKANRTLDFENQSDRPIVAAFVTAAAAHGATGIGAGVDYMGPKTLHIGFGSKAAWGAGGKTANAPGWLVAAFNEGSNNPITNGAPVLAAPASGTTPVVPGRFVVNTRGGLRLRSGPGVEFDTIKMLDSGTELTVLNLEGADNSWARVDLEGDGRVDGHVAVAFLVPADAEEHDHEEPEEDAA
jgi:hypothetical protein